MEVDWEEVARGYELDNGKQVVLTDLELATVQPRKTRTIDIEAFVDVEEVDPIYFDHLVPAAVRRERGHAAGLPAAREGDGVDRARRAGRFVMRTKEYLVLVRPREGLLALTTLLFSDEVRPPTGSRPAGASRPRSRSTRPWR